ncbi:dihydroorotase [Campylobacterota bacterium]|nr:dihydroorotase [Campylobacterota bacterium]
MLIINALLIDADTQKKGALRIKDNTIEAVGDLAPRAGEEVFDARGMWLLPGMVDLCFHLRDPGHKRIEAIDISASSALRGGITTILAAPDTTPSIDNETVAEYVLTKAAAANGARILISGEIAKENRLNNLAKLFAVGISAIEGASSLDGNILRRAFEYALMADKPAFIRCQNGALAGNGVIHDGECAARLGLPAIPDYAESSEAARVAELSDAIGAKLVIEAISAARTLNAASLYKGDRLWLQTLLPHLLLTDDACAGFDNACKLDPPLRSAQDREALIAGVKSGAVAVVSSGHFPQDESSRDRPFELASAGVDIADIFLSLAYTELVAAGKMAIGEFVRAASLNPARILGEPCGALRAGLRADLVVFDPNRTIEVKTRDGVAKSFWSGKELLGGVAAAFVAGKLRFSV